MTGQEDNLTLINELNDAESRPVFTKDKSGEIIELKDKQAVWNVSKDIIGCIASDGYNIIQHKEVFQSLIDAIKGLNLEYNPRVRQYNNTIFLDVEFPQTVINVMEGEEFVGGFRVINSYDKTTGLLILPTLSRLACSNGMVVNKVVSGRNMRHNSKMVRDFSVIIEKSLKDLVNASPRFKAIIENCMKDSIEFRLAKKVLYNLLKTEKHAKAINEYLIKNGQKENYTRWEIYCAITEYINRGGQLKPTVEQAIQMKAQRLFSTPTSELQELELPSQEASQ